MKYGMIMLALCACSTLAIGQEKNPVTSVVRGILPHRQQHIVAAAEEMPANDYSFKPTPAQMSFGHLIMHIARSNDYLCAKAADLPMPKTEELKDTDGKDKLVSALKASFDFCSTALPKVEDSKLGDTVDLWEGQKGPRATLLFELASDWADHYSAAAMYLRLKGLLPPTAKKQD